MVVIWGLFYLTLLLPVFCFNYNKAQNHHEFSSNILALAKASSALPVLHSSIMGNDNDPIDPLDDLTVPLIASRYYGYWNATNNRGEVMSYFTQTSGMSNFIGQVVRDDEIENYAVFLLFDGPYVDGKFIILSFSYDNTSDFNETSMTYSNSSITINTTFGDEFTVETFINCSGSYMVSFVNNIDGQPFNITNDDPNHLQTLIYVNSTQCGFSINGTTSLVDYDSELRAIGYSLLTTAICMIHIVGCGFVINQLSRNNIQASYISIITMAIFISVDIFMFIFNFLIAIVFRTYFNYFIAPAFWYFLLGFIFELNIVIKIWNVRHQRGYNMIDTFSKERIKFIFKLGSLILFFTNAIACLIVCLVTACWYYSSKNWFHYLLSGFFVPQIIYNAIKGAKTKFNYFYILLIGTPRILLEVIIYSKSYSESVFRLTPDYDLAYYYIGSVLSQVLILALQSLLGPRFFIPKFLLPSPYNYYVRIPRSAAIAPTEEDNCSICLLSLFDEVPGDTTLSVNESKESKYVTIMKTPCNHKYHEICLKNWMAQKLECPFCRTRLPEIPSATS